MPSPQAGTWSPARVSAAASLEHIPILDLRCVEALTWRDYFSHLQFTRLYALFYTVMAVLGVFLVLSTFYVAFPHPAWFVALEGAVTASFLLEIVMQVVAEGPAFFTWWGYCELIMLAMCTMGYLEELAVRHQTVGTVLFSRKLHLAEYPTWEIMDECILLLRYGAQAGRVFVFMKQKPLNAHFDLSPSDGVDDDPRQSPIWAPSPSEMERGDAQPSFSVSERSYDSCVEHIQAYLAGDRAA